MSGRSNISKPKLRIIIVDENRDIIHILAGSFGLKGFEVYKAYSTEECLNDPTHPEATKNCQNCPSLR